MSVAVKLAKLLMKAFADYPEPDDRYTIYTMEGIHLGRTPEEQESFAFRSAEARHRYEAENCFIERYFPWYDTGLFRGKSLLEIGSFTGGALVYWMEKYGFRSGNGIDVLPVYARAGKSFARYRNVPAEFTHGGAENLPYEPGTFDYVFTHDVMEHVRDVKQVMGECLRVLKPGGRLFCVFPQYRQPLDTHLNRATRLPALHWFFSGRTLGRAYYEVLKERGPAAEWYARRSPDLEPWERSPTLNGITIRKFRRIIAGERRWIVRYRGRSPILSEGRRARLPVFRMLRGIFILPARLPLLNELFQGRIVYILEKAA